PALTSPAAAAEPETLITTDFEDSTLGGWESSGEPALSYVADEEGGTVLRVGDRANDYSGIQTPAGLFDSLAAGDTLTFSMQARLADTDAAPTDVRFVMTPGYAWIGNTTMTADAWTTVTGTYVIPAGADAAALQAYIGTAD